MPAWVAYAAVGLPQEGERSTLTPGLHHQEPALDDHKMTPSARSWEPLGTHDWLESEKKKGSVGADDRQRRGEDQDRGDLPRK